MLRLEVETERPEGQVRDDARGYFGDLFGLEEESADERHMVFVGAGDYVSLEFNDGSDGETGLIVTTGQFEHLAREFARLVRKS